MTARTRSSTNTELQWGIGPADEFNGALEKSHNCDVLPDIFLERIPINSESETNRMTKIPNRDLLSLTFGIRVF